ncbi:hypothetical protein TKK_0002466 [Trichogramma kaykai]
MQSYRILHTLNYFNWKMMKLWEELCEAYANQLVFENSLRTFKLYKEVYALLTLRLDSNDPLIKEVLDEWAYQLLIC